MRKPSHEVLACRSRAWRAAYDGALMSLRDVMPIACSSRT
jgi:hypothetical protein